MYINSHKKHLTRKSSFDHFSAPYYLCYLIYRVSHFNVPLPKIFLFLIVERNATNKNCLIWRGTYSDVGHVVDVVVFKKFLKRLVF